jgi:ferredoxin
MKVIVDPELCQSQARCYNQFPDVFERGAGGKGMMRPDADLDDEDIRYDIQSAANQCPRGAIRIED